MGDLVLRWDGAAFRRVDVPPRGGALFKVWGSVILASSLAAQLIGHFIWK